MPRGVPNPKTMFIATETLACEVDGELQWIRAGETRVASDHPLREAHPGAFAATAAPVEVEQATAAPGEKRGAPAAGRPAESADA